MLTSIIAAVIILGTLVLIHEAGHFFVAKRCGVRVLRFSIGYPPKLFGIRRGETEYAIGGTPFGGYVRMLGDEIGDEMSPADVHTYLTEVSRDLRYAIDHPADADPELRNRLEQAREGFPPLAASETGSGVAADNSADDRVLALSQVLARDREPEQLLRRILGRAPHDAERELLDEAQRRGSVAEAIKFLSEHRPPVLAREIEQRAFPTQSLAKRFAIVLAGPAANIILAPILLAIVFMYGMPRLLPVIGEMQKGMPAAKAGLKKGDHILSIDGKQIDNWEDLSAAIKKSHGTPLHIKLERKVDGVNTIENLTISPVHMTEPGSLAGAQWVIGVLPRGDNTIERQNPLIAVPHAVMDT